MEQQAAAKYPVGDKKKGQAQQIDKLIGQRLKEIRKLKKLTQEDVAAKLGISFQQVQKYENGKNRISFGRLYELSAFMNVPLESFASNIERTGSLGGADSWRAKLSPAQNDSVSQKETDELLQIYYSLEDPQLRKNLLKFIRTMAKNLKG